MAHFQYMVPETRISCLRRPTSLGKRRAESLKSTARPRNRNLYGKTKVRPYWAATAIHCWHFNGMKDCSPCAGFTSNQTSLPPISIRGSYHSVSVCHSVTARPAHYLFRHTALATLCEYPMLPLASMYDWKEPATGSSSYPASRQ